MRDELLAALKLAQAFIAEELDCREQSMASYDDGIYVTKARDTLTVVTEAIRKAETPGNANENDPAEDAAPEAKGK